MDDTQLRNKAYIGMLEGYKVKREQIGLPNTVEKIAGEIFKGNKKIFRRSSTFELAIEANLIIVEN